MNCKTTCLFLLVLLASCIENGLGLKCYICASHEDSVCGVNFNPSKVELFKCVGNDNVCIKANGSSTTGTVVTRLCGTNDTCAIFDSCYTCTTDRCNSSTSVHLQFWVLVFVGFVFIKSYVRNIHYCNM